MGLTRELQSGGHDITADALDHGLLSLDHATVIVGAVGQLPSGLSEEQRQVVEASLVRKAQRFDPDQLRRIARRAIAGIEPDQTVVDAHENEQVRSEEEAARSQSRLSFHDNGDGTTTGHFTVSTAAAAFLRKVIESMTAPRRMPTPGEPDRRFDWDHRRGLAFAELLEHLPTDHLHHKTAATVVVTIDHSVLQDALRAAHLDLGHESRLFSPSQRVAKGLEHDTCAADGCERPYAWCELHHRRSWRRGGRTDLQNAIPLCGYHHQRIHDPGFDHRYRTDRSIRFSRRT